MNPKPWWAKLGHLSLLLLTTVYCLFPIYFMLVQSLKTPTEDVFGNPFIVMNPTLENFEELFERKGEIRGFVGDALRRSYPFLDWLVIKAGQYGPASALSLTLVPFLLVVLLVLFRLFDPWEENTV